MNRLYFGDNLHVLREHIADASVDLVYLDPPFNSKRDYNLLFKTPKGHQSDAQITAFEDSWHWGETAEREFNEVLRQSHTDIAELLRALRMAYVVMMASRLLQLHRVLKPTGSLYLHCDPTASHYSKIVLDGVFGKANFRSEISWKRSSAHKDAKQGRMQFGLFVTLAIPSKPMIVEAVKEGFYVSPVTGAQFPRIQILTIEGLLDGSEHVRSPDLASGGQTFRQAKIEQGIDPRRGDLFGG